MKKIILFFGLGIMSFFANAQGFDGIIVERYYVSDAADATASDDASAGDLPVGSVTYRIYADLKSGWALQSVFGDEFHELRLETTTSFYNNEDRGSLTANGIAVSDLANNTVLLDSWLSGGAAGDNVFGIMKSDDNGANTIINADGVLKNSPNSIGLDLTEQDGIITPTIDQTVMNVAYIGFTNEQKSMFTDNYAVSGQVLSVQNIDGAMWYIAGGATGPTADNKVLIAQITTNGVLSYKFNIQIGLVGSPTGETEIYYAEPIDVAELTSASLTGSVAPIIENNPIVSITSPIANAEFAKDNEVTIQADATDVGGSISTVEFFVDGTSIGTDNTAPYSINYTAVTGTHSLTAVAKDNDNNTTTSSQITILVNGTDIKAIQEKACLIYPTEVKEYVTVSLSDNQNNNVNYKIYDIIGNKVLDANSNSTDFSIDLSNFISGQYIIKVTTDYNVITKRIVKK